MTHLARDERIESPCIKVCALDAQNVCTGCGRTLDEIASWSRLTIDEQRSVRSMAAERLARARVCIPTGG